MDKSMKIVRNFGFKGIMSNAVDNIIPKGYVPDMQNLTVSMEGLAQNIKTPGELTVPWVEWIKDTAYELGDVVVPTSSFSGTYEDYFYICTVAGTSGSTEPSWTSPTTDNDITWTLSLSKKTDPIIQFYHYTEIGGASAEIYCIQIGLAVVVFMGANHPNGHKFLTTGMVSFASGASNDLYLYVMHPTDGLWKFLNATSGWIDLTKELDQTTPRIDPIGFYSGGLPPKSQKIFAYKNRLWAYGYLTEADDTSAASRIHWSEIASLPEDHVTGEEIIYTDVTCLRDDEHAKDAVSGLEEFTTDVTFPYHGADYWDPFYFLDVSSIGSDIVTGVVPYEQALYVFTDGGNVYNLTFYTTYDVTCQQIATVVDGVPTTNHTVGNFVTAGKGIYYIGSKGLYAFATPTPVKISLPVQNLIDLVIDDPKGVCYFNDRVYFALSDEVWVFDIVKGTWEKYVYPFQIETIYSSDHVYATTDEGEVYKLDTEDSTYLSWYMDTQKIDLGNLFLEKRPEDIVVHFKIPTASSTVSIVMTDEEDVDTNVATTAETFIMGRTGLLDEKHYPIYKDIVKAVNFRLSGSGEVKILGYDVLFKTYHRKRI